MANLRTRWTGFALAALVAASGSGPAARADAENLPGKSFVLRGARVERGDGTFVDDAVLIVRDGKVEALGTAADVPIPAGLPVVEGRGGTVLPGLVLPHTRLGLNAPQGSAERATPSESVRDELNPFHPIWSVAADCGVAWAGVMPGPGAPAGEAIAVRPSLAGTPGFTGEEGRFLRIDVEATTGWTRGLDGALKQAKKEIEAEDRHAELMEKYLAAKAEFEARKNAHDEAVKAHAAAEAAAKAAAEKEKKPAPTPVPPPAAPADLKPPTEPSAPKSDERTAVVRDALRRRIPVAVMCGSDTDADRALEVLRPWRMRLVFWAAGDTWKLADRLVGADAVAMVVRTGPVTEVGGLDRVNPAAALHSAGGRVAVAPLEESRNGLTRLLVQVGEWIHDGLTRADAVRAVTSNGAEALGLGDRAGLLAPGRAADLLLFDGDPFEGATRLRAVWLDGVPRSGEERP